MKSTGIIREIDRVGRIVLPIELRQSLSIHEGDSIGIFTDQDKIILQKCEDSCIFCGSTDTLQKFKGKMVCANCKAELTK